MDGHTTHTYATHDPHIRHIRLAGDYDGADAIQATLRRTYSVVLDDKLGTWRLVLQPGGYVRPARPPPRRPRARLHQHSDRPSGPK